MKTIAFYLPQYHPTPENSRWWGDGFTEWTNVTKAKPLFVDHYQPQLPRDLGFYDLRMPEIRQRQADLASAAGLDAFCYYHYWFNGRQILERPFSETLWSGSPKFPFCICWANESWTGIWHGAPDRLLIKQDYGGVDEYTCHFNALLPAFLDGRYFTLEEKPVVVIWRPFDIPEGEQFLQTWRTLAKRNGLPGIHFVAFRHFAVSYQPLDHGYDAEIHLQMPPRRSNLEPDRSSPLPAVYDMTGLIKHDFFTPKQKSNGQIYPCSIPNWDNTPRSGSNGIVFQNATPDLFLEQLNAMQRWIDQGSAPPSLHFVKSWNEWAEGNFLEPDQRYGHGFLKAIHSYKRNT